MTLSQVTDHGSVSVMYMKQHKSRGNVGDTVTSHRSWVCQCYMKQHKSRGNVGDTVTSHRSWDCQCYVYETT